MSMDRLSRVIAGGCLTLALGIVVSASGCRSARNDVPKGKPYSTNGNPPAVGFNSDPHPSTSVGNGMYQPNADANGAGGGANPQYGTLAPNMSPTGMPTGNRYGPVGTNGTTPSQ
jgi:hypothetical protein